MDTLIVKTAPEADFFRRGRELAKLADRGEALPETKVISFEDPADLLKLLTAARATLIHSIKAEPGSITAISQRLHRDRSAVKRDIDALAKFGLVTVEQTVLPGHGSMKVVHATAKRFKLEALLA